MRSAAGEGASAAAVILAAGKGTRMHSELPKALHPICGQPMVRHVLETALKTGCRRTVVVAGHEFRQVKESLLGSGAELVRQRRRLGSGHAAFQSARRLLKFKGPVIVLYCDTPLVTAGTLRLLLENHRKNSTDCSLLSVRSSDPSGYGRIKRGFAGAVEKIIEEGDASSGEKAIREINVGCYVFDARKLFGALGRVRKNAGKKEYYLTDVVEILSASGKVDAVETENAEETLGVNTRSDLMQIETRMQQRILDRLAAQGVRIRDPRTTTIDAGVRIGQDTVILPNTVIEKGVVIGRDCVIGPFARIRGVSRVGDGAVIGNFVEIVRSKIGAGTQIKHLSYIGDAEIGSGVNIGAGTITANYDGRRKHRTVIRDGAQIGSGTVLVAPVVIGRTARTGAGAVVTKGRNVPAGGVVVGVPAKALRRPRAARR